MVVFPTPQSRLKEARSQALYMLSDGPNTEAARYFNKEMSDDLVTAKALREAGIAGKLVNAARTGDKPEFERLIDTIRLPE